MFPPRRTRRFPRLVIDDMPDVGTIETFAQTFFTDFRRSIDGGQGAVGVGAKPRDGFGNILDLKGRRPVGRRRRASSGGGFEADGRRD